MVDLYEPYIEPGTSLQYSAFSSILSGIFLEEDAPLEEKNCSLCLTFIVIITVTS